MYKLIHLQNCNEVKESIYQKCLLLKKEKTLDPVCFQRINIEYIQGLFDAEGCFFISNKNKNYFRISLTQKSYPSVLEEIQKLLNFGSIVESCKFVIYKKSDCLRFIQWIKNGLIVKYNQALAFETFLTTKDEMVKEEMYKICNEEKHKIEHFTELNSSPQGKDGYRQIVHVRNLKEKVCKELLLKKNYKDKSENMKREGNVHFGKKFSEDTKKKMSLSIRNAKGSVSDEIIVKVRKLMEEKKTIKEIIEFLKLPRHTISRIKNGDIVCRNETKTEKKSVSQEEINISKRKIRIDEIFFVIEKCVKGMKPSEILTKLITIRNNYQLENTLTIDIIKNIKRTILQNKVPFYQSELSPEKYNYYKEMIELYNIHSCKE
jgi:hypothetical protein